MAIEDETAVGSIIEKAPLLKSRLARLQTLVWVQRCTRIFLRVAWLGASLVLIIWAFNRLAGLSLSAAAWGAIGIGFMLITTGLFALRRPPLRQLTWLVDQKLGTREQLSTAWEAAQAGARAPVADELIDDAIALTAQIHQRVRAAGWFLWRELPALLIVTILLILVFGLETPPANLPELVPPALVLAGSDPRADDIFPEGISALPTITPTPAQPDNESSQPEQQSSGSEAAQTPLTANELQQLQSSLQQMGQQLNQSAATNEQAQRLQQNDLHEAAGAIQSLSDNLEAFSDETKEKISASMREAANQMQGENLQELHSNMQEAADRIDAQLASEQAADNLQSLLTKEQMDQVAADLREISQQLKSPSQLPGSGIEQGSAEEGDAANTPTTRPEKSEAQAMDRIENQGEMLEFSVLDENEQKLLVPSDQDPLSIQAGSQPAGSAQSINYLLDEMTNTNWITPYQYPWKWRHVVSSYFQR